MTGVENKKRRRGCGTASKVISLIIGMLLIYESAVEAITLRLGYVPKKHETSTQAKAERAILERFLELHPEIEEVKSSTGITIPGIASSDIVMMSMAAGLAPDVMYVNFRKSSSFIEQGFLYPLDEYIKELPPGYLEEKLHPKLWPIIKQKGPPDSNEHIYALPYGAPLVLGLQYRKDLFKKAGLDPNKPPKTWDEFYEYAMRLTDQEKGQYGWVIEIGMEGAWLFFNFIYQSGSEIVEQDKDGIWRAVYNNEKTVTALKFYEKLLKSKWTKDGKEYKGVILRTDRPWREWNRGKIGMTFSYIGGEGNVLDPDLIGVAPMFAGPYEIHGTEFNQTILGINGTIKDKIVRDVAWEYIKFRMGDEANEIVTSVYVETGEGKFVNPEFLKKFGYKEILEDVPKEWIEINEEAFKSEYLRPEPYGKNCDLIYYEFVEPMDMVSLYDNVHYREVLDKAAKHTNEKLLGYIEPEELKKRRTIMGVIVGLSIIGIIFAGIRTFKTVIIPMLKESVKVSSDERKIRKRKRLKIVAFFFMFPVLVSTLIWAYYPLARGMLMAFQDYKVTGASKFVGLDNFVMLFWNPVFWLAFKNTAIFTVLTLSLGFFAPIVLALLLNEIPKGTLLYRTIYYLPGLTSGIVILLLWKQFYDPSPAGFLNVLLKFFGLPVQKWLQDPKLAMVCTIIPGIWAGVGGGSILYLAALKNIPEELYEAASIDGASYWYKIRYITLPTLKILLITGFVGAFIGAFQSAGNILLMTGGGPLHATHVLALEIFYSAFIYLRFGYSTAMAWILGSMLIGFTIYNLKVIRNVRWAVTTK